MRAQSKPKKERSGGRANRAAAHYGANDTYHEENSDDENAISLSAIKNSFKKPTGATGVSQCKCLFCFLSNSKNNSNEAETNDLKLQNCNQFSAASNIYSSDEEGSDFEAGKPKKHQKSKALKDSDEESKSGSDEESGSNDEKEEAEENSD